jgi:hypothetical protein
MNKIKIRILVASCSVILMTLMALPSALAMQPEINAFEPATAAAPVQRFRRLGPYATLRRANEVAYYARRQGYRTKIYYGGSLYSGTRRYYVDVW